LALQEGETSNTLSSEDPALVFGMSGLAYQGVVLAYDRDGEQRDKTGASLWNMLTGHALSGQQYGRQLQAGRLTCGVMQWRAWESLHPHTTIAARRPELTPEYKKDLYGPYYQQDRLMYSVAPQLGDARLAELKLSNKSRGVGLVEANSKILPRCFFLPHEAVVSADLHDGSHSFGTWKATIGSDKVTLRHQAADVGFR
ncbi:MAG: DUF3179 domain-containing protein, partial [bacterium]|nr:DUF3179 domain-containing protein [bacterium]